MKASFVPIRVNPGKMKEVIQIYDQSVVPVLKQQKGYKGVLVLTNDMTNKCYILGLWETEEDAKAFETSGTFQAQVAKFAELFAERPSREIYELSIQ